MGHADFLFYPGSHLPENTPVRTLQWVQTGGMSRPPRGWRGRGEARAGVRNCSAFPVFYDAAHIQVNQICGLGAPGRTQMATA
jgi:hypothetical protein